MIRRLSVCVLVLVACGDRTNEPAKPRKQDPASPPVASRAALEAECNRASARRRECTDAYIPALVGWRVELDVPTGIAAMDRKQGRGAVVASAKREWAAGDATQSATWCAEDARNADEKQLSTLIDVDKRCNDIPECSAFVACIEPAERQRLSAHKAADGSLRAAAEAECNRVAIRTRECKNTFIPAMIGWRVELDVPAGTAAMDRKIGRAKIVAAAKKEYEANHSDEQIAARCAEDAALADAATSNVTIDRGKRCAGIADCDAFVACIAPVSRQWLEAQKAAEASGADTSRYKR